MVRFSGSVDDEEVLNGGVERFLGLWIGGGEVKRKNLNLIGTESRRID